ncbi:MAG: CDP-diacylglycerol--glycerol-3-phosphate 3-phosphatidyltransferase [Oscillospiraceae bacterium]|nr:CDP-diacylglycerol--glycerol-3-phosphate 3-phosphatidyltransferase [Oscillospiraceae bacterium]
MTIANKLTVARVVMIPVFMIVLYLGFPGSNYVALGIFVLASLTDFADGKLARARNEVTTFGKFMDPLADKVLVFAAMIWFTGEGVIPAWVTLVVIARELAVTGMRLVAVDAGRVIAAAWSGKIKTASTMICLIILFFPVPEWLRWVCLIVIAGTTVYSGCEYFVKNRDVINFSK